MCSDSDITPVQDVSSREQKYPAKARQFLEKGRQQHRAFQERYERVRALVRLGVAGAREEALRIKQILAGNGKMMELMTAWGEAYITMMDAGGPENPEALAVYKATYAELGSQVPLATVRMMEKTIEQRQRRRGGHTKTAL